MSLSSKTMASMSLHTLDLAALPCLTLSTLKIELQALEASLHPGPCMTGEPYECYCRRCMSS